MRARVLVRPKRGILDPQGQAVERALPALGFSGVSNVHGGRPIRLEAEGEAHLLPGALLPNTSLKFVFRQVGLQVADANTPFTRACAQGEALSIPVKHTTGRYYSPEPVRVVLRYAPGQNPNGSQDDIAGVCNQAGNVFGLMPHPEHAVDPLTGSIDGLKLFESVREHAAELTAAG